MRYGVKTVFMTLLFHALVVSFGFDIQVDFQRFSERRVGKGVSGIVSALYPGVQHEWSWGLVEIS